MASSSTFLDYALFQLTPTRTRCDLVLFYGRKTEKLASGLFEPFISHLKFAKDQISRGGYSIKLCPQTTNATWFTKATFERFVRFVNTPAVLERFVSLEKEILQIQSSSQANEYGDGQLEEGNGLASNSNTRKSNDFSKLKGELERTEPKENSRAQLQRLLETRKKLLLKEQAMAYARSLVAGFDVDDIDHLISFADAFGASRLREACINFKELCKKKGGDGLWMQELEAMQACPPSELSFFGTSGIVLNNEATTLNPNIILNLPKGDSTASSDSRNDDNSATSEQTPTATNKVPVSMSWPNQMPQHLYNFQNPMQQFPPYQGYPFPMQPIPPHYAMSMQWPPNLKESDLLKKEKFLNKKGGETESSSSEVGSGSDSYIQQEKKHSSADASDRKKRGKRSSKTVVIRNINYITPKRRNGDESSSDEDDFIDEDSLQEKVNGVIGSLEKLHKSNSINHRRKGSHIGNGSTDETVQDFDDGLVSNPSGEGKKNENWDAFQNLLMRDEETTVDGINRLHPMDAQGDHFTVKNSGMDLESEAVPNRIMAASDSFVVIQRNGGYEDRDRRETIENPENVRPVMKRRDFIDGDLVIPQRIEESGSAVSGILCTNESTIMKPGKGEDWFVINHSGEPANENSKNEDIIANGDILEVEKVRKTIVDDSFMVHARPIAGDPYDFQWKTDISMAADLTLSSQLDSGIVKQNNEMLATYEPTDLCMILGRDSGFESTRESWSTDHGIDISFMETDSKSTNVETNNDAVKNPPSNCDNTIVKKKEKKVPGKEVRPKVLPLSKSKQPSPASRPLVQKSKLEKEEEIRKKMEELSIQRQKRIAERTAASGYAQAATKKIPSESKQLKGSIKLNKNTTHSITRDTNKVSSIKVRAA